MTKQDKLQDIDIWIEPLDNFKPDPNNANKGTERGAYMNRKSVETLGAGRSLVADKDGRIVAGNKTQESLIDMDMTEAIVIETDGTRPIVHKRRDWDLEENEGDNPARQYAYADNRTSQVGFELDTEQLQLDLDAGLDLGDWFQDFELIDNEIPDTWNEYDESVADDVEMMECPHCGKEFPK